MSPIDRRLNSWQWQLNVLTVVLSCLAIALAFASQRTLAQLCLVLVTLSFIGSALVAWQRYQRNKQRRDEILASFEQERQVQLQELFDQARQLKNLPPDASDNNGFKAMVQSGEERIAAQQKKRKGGGQGGAK